MTTNVNSGPPIATLAFWLRWLDQWASFYETDPIAEQQRSREPMSARDRAQALYLLKERALQTLYASESPSISLGVLEGPRTEARVWLCEQCAKTARQQGVSAREYAERTGGCKNCQREGREPDYFSLYVLYVDYGPLGRWQFHTPVPLGRPYLPPPRSPEAPVVGMRPLDSEGRLQRVGTPISKDDRREYPEAEVVWRVWQGIKAVSEDIAV